MSLTVFANILIDDEERFQRLQESFFSFYKCDINYWVINVRGKYKEQTKLFLEKNLGKNILKVYFLNSKKGWFHDSSQMLEKITTKYVFVWNEDHKNLLDQSEFNEIINEIIENKVDNFTYSLSFNGDLYKSMLIEETIQTNKIAYLDYNLKLHEKRMELINKYKLLGQEYIISLVSINTRELFKKIIFTNDPPIKRWSKQKPFDFEKAPNDIHWLPFRFGVPRKEFFKCMDKEWNEVGSRINYTEKKEKNIIKILKSRVYQILKFFLKKPVIFFRELINNFISRKIKKFND